MHKEATKIVSVVKGILSVQNIYLSLNPICASSCLLVVTDFDRVSIFFQLDKKGLPILYAKTP